MIYGDLFVHIFIFYRKRQTVLFALNTKNYISQCCFGIPQDLTTLSLCYWPRVLFWIGKPIVTLLLAVITGTRVTTTGFVLITIAILSLPPAHLFRINLIQWFCGSNCTSKSETDISCVNQRR